MIEETICNEILAQFKGQALSKVNKTKFLSRHGVVKLLNIKKKEVLKQAWDKKNYILNNGIKTNNQFLMATGKNRREWKIAF